MTVFKPIGNRILVEMLPVEDVSSGGIIIPEMAQKRSSKAVVKIVAGGPKTKKGKVLPAEVKAGDIVHINTYAGTDLVLDGRKVKLIDHNDVLALDTAPV